MEQIITKAKQAETSIARILIAALQAMGTLLLYATITNQRIEQWNPTAGFLLYILLMILYIFLLKGRKE